MAEAVVVGVDDDEFGQRVAAAVVLRNVRLLPTICVPLLKAISESRIHGFWLTAIVASRYFDTHRAPRRSKVQAVELQTALTASGDK